jgi:Kef-type K+ transport system membrane component KefB
MGLLNQPIGIQTISLAAVEDIVVWVILAIASAFSSGGSALQGLYTLLLTIGFIAIMVLIIRPILGSIHNYYLRRNSDTNVYLVVGCFLLLVVAAFTTEVMGKFSRHKMSSRHSLATRMNRNLENLESFF